MLDWHGKVYVPNNLFQFTLAGELCLRIRYDEVVWGSSDAVVCLIFGSGLYSLNLSLADRAKNSLDQTTPLGEIWDDSRITPWNGDSS